MAAVVRVDCRRKACRLSKHSRDREIAPGMVHCPRKLHVGVAGWPKKIENHVGTDRFEPGDPRRIAQRTAAAPRTPAAIEGWDELSDADRTFVQQMVNKLRRAASED